MARYDLLNQLPNNVSPSVAWKEITDAIRNGYRSVEVVERTVSGDQVWEIRGWDDFRHDDSNKKTFPPNTEAHCPACPEKP